MFQNEKFNLLNSDFNENKNSHAIIFYTNDFESCKSDVYQLIENIMGKNNATKDNDLIIIPKSDKSKILKEDILHIRNTFKNTSYNNVKRIYLIEELHKLNSSSANLILKFLEEPYDGVIALFITNNLDSVLKTIKSRCQIYKVFYNSKKELNRESYKIIDDLLNEDKYISLFKSKKQFEKYDRNELIMLFKDYLEYCYTEEKINNIEVIKKINKALNLLINNVNIDYIFNYIFIESEL